MMVHELIEYLKTLPQDYKVCMDYVINNELTQDQFEVYEEDKEVCIFV